MASDVHDVARARVTPTPLNIVSNRALETIPEALARGANTVIAASLHDVTRALEAQAARPRAAAIAVDLVGHSTRDHQLLRLGATTIDALDLGVRRFFEGIARSGVLRDINAVCLRLIGCETALSASGQRTMRLLAAVLGMPVYGTRKRISRMHNTELGFCPLFHNLLVDTAPRKTPWLLAMTPPPS
jgi:hypothetical protein